MSIHDADQAIKKAESLLKEVRESNQAFIAKTGKLADKMEDEMLKAEVLWKKTEGQLQALEKEAGNEVEKALKDFVVGKDVQAKKAA